MRKKWKYLIMFAGICLMGYGTVLGAFTLRKTFSNTLTTGNLGINLHIDSEDSKAVKEEQSILFQKAVPGETLNSMAWVENDRDYPLTLTVKVEKPREVLLLSEDSADWVVQGNVEGSEEVLYAYEKTLYPGESTSHIFDQLKISQDVSNGKEGNTTLTADGILHINAYAVQLISDGSEIAASGHSHVVFGAAGENFYQTSTGSDLFQALKGMLPGETYVQTITLTNQDSRSLRFYLSSKVIQELTNTQKPKEAIYQIKVTKEKQVLYDKIIGSGTYQNSDEIYLGTLKKGESQDLTIELTIQGESMGNAYQDAKGIVDLTYRTEYENGGNPTPEPSRSTSTYTTTTASRSNPETILAKVAKTGDTIGISFLIIMLLAGCTISVIILVRQKRSK